MEKDEITLDQLLESMRSQGREDSSGVFSLSPGKALEKLRDFRLPKEDYYILKLVQSAVAAGASRVEVTCTPTRVELSHDGDPLGVDSMPDLLAIMVDSGQQQEARELYHLAAGVVGSLAVSPRHLLVESWDGQAGLSHRWSADSWLTRELTTSPDWSVRFGLARRVGEVVSQ